MHTAQLAAAEAAPCRVVQLRRAVDEWQATTRRSMIGGHKVYLTVGVHPDDGMPCHVSVVLAKEGSTSGGALRTFSEAVSKALMRGEPLKEVIEDHWDVGYEPCGRTNDPVVPFAKSIPDYVVRRLAAEFLSPGDFAALEQKAKELGWE